MRCLHILPPGTCKILRRGAAFYLSLLFSLNSLGSLVTCTPKSPILMSNPEAGIRVEGLTKIYGTQRAVDNISFRVPQGQIVGFLGPNGAGKSTTMKILTCFLPATEGNAWVEGLSVKEQPDAVRRNIGYLPEHNPLYLDMYVYEFLRFAGRLYGMTGKQLKTRVPRVVEQTGLGPEQHKKIGMLSKGFRQRVGLAQALIHDPPVLILDEPTSGFDPNMVIEIRKLIQQLGKEKTVLFSSHILSEVEAVARRVVIIHKGQILQDAPLTDLQAGADGETILEVEFEQPGFDPQPLQQLAGVRKVEAQSSTAFKLYAEAGSDIRKAVYEQSVAQANPILALNKVQSRLEDVFRQLTNPEQAPSN